MATQNIHVAASSDDARDGDAGAYNHTGGNTDIGLFGSENYSAGCRFLALDPGQGDTINSLTMTFLVSLAARDDAVLDVHADDVDDSATFSSTDSPLDRVRTTAKVDWDFTNVGATSQTSPNLASVLQEVVDRAGWVTGNDASILLIHAGTSEQLQFFAFDDAGTSEPYIDIDWTAAGGGGGGDGTDFPWSMQVVPAMPPVAVIGY